MIDHKSLSDLSIELGYPLPSEECFAMADKVHDVLCDLTSCVVDMEEEDVITIRFTLDGRDCAVDIEESLDVFLFLYRGNVVEVDSITPNWESVLRGLFE